MDYRLKAILMLLGLVVTQGGRPPGWPRRWRWPFEYPPKHARWPFVRRRLHEDAPPEAAGAPRSPARFVVLLVACLFGYGALRALGALG